MNQHNQKEFHFTAKTWNMPVQRFMTTSCKTSRCKTCPNLSSCRTFSSNITRHKFFSDKPINYNCKSKFVIYLIECKTCSAQYVGSTSNALHKRMNSHRSSIKQLRTYFASHFKSNGHSFNEATIKIIDSLNLQDFNSEKEAKAALFKLEQEYIDTLVTLYPFGLNDRTLNNGSVSAGNLSQNAYFCSPITRRPRSHGCRNSIYKGSNKLKVSTCSPKPVNKTEEIENLYTLFKSKHFYDFYIKLRAFNFESIKSINIHICRHQDTHFKAVVMSFCMNKIVKKQDSIGDKSNFILFDFCSKQIDDINLHSVFTNKNILSKLPECVKNNFKRPMFMFKYNKPMHTIVCNYGKFLKSLNISKINEISHSSCHCEEYSSFIYPPTGHVITGDMNIIEDPHLKNIIKMGPKLRCNNAFNKRSVLLELCNSFKDFVDRFCKKYDISSSLFDNWKQSIKKLLRSKIYKIDHTASTLGNFNNTSNVPLPLSYDAVRRHPEIIKLQNHFVITPLDKAGSNYGFTCKKHYCYILMKELGFDLLTLQSHGNNTYQPVSKSSDELIAEHTSILNDLFEMEIKEENKKLPFLYAIPKLHKNPFKFRFISGARACTTKQISILLNNALLCIRNKLKSDCLKSSVDTNFNFFLSINSTTEFLNKLNTIPKIWSAECMIFLHYTLV